jgi:hypothetical protein
VCVPLKDATVLDFISLYVLALMWFLLALPRKTANRILEILFPILRRPL